MRLPVPAALATLVLALAAAGCGDDVEPIDGAGAPAITSPGTTIPFESGGGDGSGGDGRAADEDRGGIAAGPDAGTP